MNQDRLKLWLDALRSGEYQQGVMYLNANGKYCCLGVLCEIAIQNGVKVTRDTDANGVVHYDGQTAFPPALVSEWLGEEAGNIQGRVNGELFYATTMNDSNQYSFNTIADALEAAHAKQEAVQ